jgi:hypothetical protein
MFLGPIAVIYNILSLVWLVGLVLFIAGLIGKYARKRINNDLCKATRQAGYIIILLSFSWQNFDGFLWGVLSDGPANLMTATVMESLLCVLMIIQLVIFTRRLWRWWQKKKYNKIFLLSYSGFVALSLVLFAMPVISLIVNDPYHYYIKQCRYVKPCGIKFNDLNAPGDNSNCPCVDLKTNLQQPKKDIQE